MRWLQFKLVRLALIGLALMAVGATWHRWFRLKHLEFVQAPGEDQDRVYYPLIDTGSGMYIPMSYAKQVDFIFYNSRPIDLREPMSLNVRWHFYRPFWFKRYGLVFLRHHPGHKPDRSDARVLWITPAEMDVALSKGQLQIPLISTLPKINIPAPPAELKAR